MKTKEEVKEFLESSIVTLDNDVAELNQRLNEVKAELDSISQNGNYYYSEYQKEKKKFFEELAPEEKTLVEERDRLEKRKARSKWLGLAVLALHLFVSIFIMVKQDFEFSMPTVAVFGIVLAVAIAVYIIPVAIRKSILNGKIKPVNRNERIAEYDKKVLEEFKKYRKNVDDTQATITKYRAEISQIMGDIQRKEKIKADGLHQLDELDFNFAFAGSILFYGKEKRNHYDIYIDGRHYDTVRGHQIARIKLTPGLHSVKFENTSYNIVDKSVDYRYSFNTEQMEVGELPEAYAYICEYKTLTRVSGESFQNITKTKLI